MIVRQEHAELASVFTSGMFAALAADDPAPISMRLLYLERLVAGSPSATLAEAFEAAHATLRRSYRSEYVYKNSVVSKLIFGRHSPATASALLELPVGRSIADVVVFNGTSTAYEIKTDLDSFARLPSQLAEYQRCFEHVNVVTSIARVDAALQVVPMGVGVVGLRRNGSLSTVRASRGDLTRLDQGQLFELLRQSEAVSVLSRAISYRIDVPPGDLWERSKQLFMSLPLEVAYRNVVSVLRDRGKQGASLASRVDFPHSLRALAYATRLTSRGRAQVGRRLSARATPHWGFD